MFMLCTSKQCILHQFKQPFKTMHKHILHQYKQPVNCVDTVEKYSDPRNKQRGDHSGNQITFDGLCGEYCAGIFN
ncbi:hypothetical protein GJ496_009931 [Pomphorhynchus laevis]|nr:hypothetical protein GJ496_009931 [Pomphorhynchus laevis]